MVSESMSPSRLSESTRAQLTSIGNSKPIEEEHKPRSTLSELAALNLAGREARKSNEPVDNEEEEQSPGPGAQLGLVFMPPVI